MGAGTRPSEDSTQLPVRVRAGIGSVLSSACSSLRPGLLAWNPGMALRLLWETEHSGGQGQSVYSSRTLRTVAFSAETSPGMSGVSPLPRTTGPGGPDHPAATGQGLIPD